MGDFIVLAVLALMVGASVWNLRKDKKTAGCCGNCSGCAGGCSRQRQ